MYSDTNVDLAIEVTISADNITPDRAREIVAGVVMEIAADITARREISVTAALLPDPEPTSVAFYPGLTKDQAEEFRKWQERHARLDTDEREKTSAQAMDEAAPYVAPYMTSPITIDQIGEYLGSRASDEALVVVIADTYADACLVVDAIEVHSREVPNTGEITSSGHTNGARNVRYAHGARVRAVARGSSRFSADLVIVVPGVHSQDAYTNAALMTNGKPSGSVRHLTGIPNLTDAHLVEMDEADPYVVPYLAVPMTIMNVVEWVKANPNRVALVVAETWDAAESTVAEIERRTRDAGMDVSVPRSVGTARFYTTTDVAVIAVQPDGLSGRIAGLVLVVTRDTDEHTQETYASAAGVIATRTDGVVAHLVEGTPAS